LNSSSLIDNIFPIPAKERIYLKLVNTEDVDVQIINSAGIVQISQHHETGPDSITEIELEELNPGLYFIRVSSGERVESRKIIIRK
jgi:hypothetical protein